MTNKPQFVGEKRAVALKDACTLIMGQSPSSDSYNVENHGLPFYQGNADFGEKYPTPRSWCTDPKKVAEKDDILISVRAPIGAINIASEQCCIGRGVAAIRPKPNLVEANFLCHQLIASRKRLEAMGTGSTFKAVGKTNLSNFPIALYPKSTQEIMGRQLDRIVEQIKDANNQLVSLDSLVKSRFVEMFGNPTAEPSNDGTVPIGEFAEVRTGATPLRTEPKYYGGPIPWVKTGEVARNFANGVEETISNYAIEETNCKVFPAGTVLVAMYGQGDTRGKTAILPFDAATNQACAAILPGRKHDSFFLNSQLQLLYTDMRAKSLGGNQKNLSLGIIKALEVKLPPLALQQEFAAFVAQVDKSRFAYIWNRTKSVGQTLSGPSSTLAIQHVEPQTRSKYWADASSLPFWLSVEAVLILKTPRVCVLILTGQIGAIWCNSSTWGDA